MSNGAGVVRISLCDAAEKGDVAVLHEIITNKLEKVNRHEMWQRTALHWACLTGQYQAVTYLIENGADVDASDDEGWTGLHWAANNGHVELVKLLLKNSADVSLIDQNGRTAKSLAATPEINELIPLSDPSSDSGEMDVIPMSTDEVVEAPDIWDAAEQGKIEQIHQFIRAGVDVNTVGMWDRTPLHWAALAGQTEVIKILLSMGASAHYQDDEGWTPFHWAVNNSHLESVQLMLQYFNYKSLNVIDQFGRTPIQLARSTEIIQLLSMHQQNCMLSPADTPTVIIIGAGMAGISAARELQSRGAHVVILEGSSRIGGRTFTSSVGGAPVDLGASWVHGTLGNPLSDLIKHFNVPLHLKTGALDLYDEDGTPHSAEQIAFMNRRFKAVMRIIDRERDMARSDCTLSEAFEKALCFAESSGNGLRSTTAKEDRLMKWLISKIETYYSSTFEELSFMYYADEKMLPGGEAEPIGGYQVLIQHMCKGLHIELEQKVDSISYSKSGVEVMTNRGKFVADYAICTVPLGVLKSNTIRFNPPLPDSKQKAIDVLGVGLMNKVALQFPTNFWSEDTESIGYTSSTKGKYRWFFNLKSSGSNTLLAFLTSHIAIESEQLPDHEVVANLMEVLRKIYGASIPEPTATLVTHWGADPFAMGAYSYLKYGSTSDDYDEMAKPVENLLFAGEATSKDFPGYVHGAYVSGLREALRILKNY